MSFQKQKRQIGQKHSSECAWARYTKFHMSLGSWDKPKTASSPSVVPGKGGVGHNTHGNYLYPIAIIQTIQNMHLPSHASQEVSVTRDVEGSI
jgi:hypothetical protein